MGPSTSIRTGTISDLSYVSHLHRTLSGSLGFLSTTALCDYLTRGHVSILEIDETPAAFVLRGAWRPCTRIFMAAVELELHRLSFGQQLCDYVTRDAHRRGVSAIALVCRDGLPANAFWQACDFTLVHTQLGGLKRRKICNVYARPLRSSAIPDLATLALARRGRPPAAESLHTQTYEGVEPELRRR